MNPSTDELFRQLNTITAELQTRGAFHLKLDLTIQYTTDNYGMGCSETVMHTILKIPCPPDAVLTLFSQPKSEILSQLLKTSASRGDRYSYYGKRITQCDITIECGSYPSFDLKEVQSMFEELVKL